MKKIKWGILGPGEIAHKFTDDLNLIPTAELVAVGSRSKERADDFAKEYNIKKSYDSYQELAQDPEVDVVYIATPHSFHKENTLLCLQEGKSVLCEKPFALNSIEAEEMINCARGQKVFLMEAMLTRFLPVT